MPGRVRSTCTVLCGSQQRNADRSNRVKAFIHVFYARLSDGNPKDKVKASNFLDRGELNRTITLISLVVYLEYFGVYRGKFA